MTESKVRFWSAWEDRLLRGVEGLAGDEVVELAKWFRRSPKQVITHFHARINKPSGPQKPLEDLGDDPLYDHDFQDTLADIGVLIRVPIRHSEFRNAYLNIPSGSRTEDLLDFQLRNRDYYVARPKISEALFNGSTDGFDLNLIAHHARILKAVSAPPVFAILYGVGLASGILEMKFKFKQLQVLSRLVGQAGQWVGTDEISPDMYNGRMDKGARLDVSHHVMVIRRHSKYGQTFTIDTDHGGGYRFRHL